MTTLSSAGWVIHDVGLASAIGGSMFGKLALQPAIDEVSDAQERDQVSDVAWRRFSLINLASHVAFAVPWFVGRALLDGKEVSPRAQALVRAKDVLVGASLASGIASIVFGRMLGRRVKRGEGPDRRREDRERMTEGLRERAMQRPMIKRRSDALDRVVGTLGFINLLATTGVLAVTALLSMEAGKSVRFAAESRRLP